MVSDEYINSKADELNLNEYYSNIFKDTLNLKEDVSKFNELIEKYDKCVNGIENVLNFLTENKDNNKLFVIQSNIKTKSKVKINDICL